MPVLVLCGTRTARFFQQVATSLTGRFENGRFALVEGAGHLGPQFRAEDVAEALAGALAPATA